LLAETTLSDLDSDTKAETEINDKSNDYSTGSSELTSDYYSNGSNSNESTLNVPGIGHLSTIGDSTRLMYPVNFESTLISHQDDDYH
jgi:hypothetical protein